ncbi:MAG TPA: terminase TerL endonuclease subunit, partial [Roseococcus sp.]|nr:terminase TerL endonuclease subunit [Roseococcus sp.]
FPPDMLKAKAHREPRNWRITNPNLGASVDEAFLAREFEKARAAGDAALRDFEAKHLNVQIDVGGGSDGWAGAAVWTRGNGGPRTLAELLDRSECVTLGVDGGGLDDLFGFGAIGRERETRRWLGWGHALISPEGMERRKANATVYQDFIADGDLTLVDGLPDDLAWIVEHVGLVKDAGLLAMVGADPAGIGGLVDALAEIGVTEDAKLLTGVPQGIRLMNASKTVERKLADGTFKHSGSRLLAWCAGNAKVRQTSTAVLIERAASGYGKIDPLMAVFNAAHLMGFNPQPAIPLTASDILTVI